MPVDHRRSLALRTIYTRIRHFAHNHEFVIIWLAHIQPIGQSGLPLQTIAARMSG